MDLMLLAAIEQEDLGDMSEAREPAGWD